MSRKAAATVTGCALWKQGVAAKRELADKYGDFGVQPQGRVRLRLRSGGRRKPASLGAIAHLAIWNLLLSNDDIASIWSAGASDLGACAMYHSFT